MPLTVKRVARLTTRGRYLDGRGLYLQIETATNKSWLLRYQFRGRKRWMGLGSTADFSLAEARERARRMRQLLADHTDPLDVRKAERDQRALEAARNKTFAAVAQEYYDAHEGSWTSVPHRRGFLATLRDYAFPTLGALSVQAIDETMVLATLLCVPKT